jgi:hypothetical protein
MEFIRHTITKIDSHGPGEGGVRDLPARRYFFGAAPQNFDVWRAKDAPDAEVPHPALRADLSRLGEVFCPLHHENRPYLTSQGVTFWVRRRITFCLP